MLRWIILLRLHLRLLNTPGPLWQHHADVLKMDGADLEVAIMNERGPRASQLVRSVALF